MEPNQKPTPKEDGIRRVSAYDPAAVRGVQNAYASLKSIFRGTGAKITMDAQDLSSGFGFLTVSGRWFLTNEPGKLAECLRGATNAEFVWKTDGSIELNLGYYDLTKDSEV